MSQDVSASLPVERLRSKKVIGELFARGASGSSKTIAVRCLLGEVDEVCVAVISPKRLGNAVIRNRIRRRLRAAVREPGVGLQPGCFAVLARRNIADLPYERLKADVASAIARACKAAQ
ncbi:MAG: ribonuclease P protein component [Planctomycetota bacterium]